MLKNDKIAYTEFGYHDRPHVANSEDQIAAHNAYPHSEVGFVVAAAHERKMDMLLQLFSSVVRDAAMNKTFMELINTDTGIGWRYPGQLWHAMAYISMIYYGMLGMEYDQHGLTFNHPCLPKVFTGLKITNFKYRSASFDIATKGCGYFKQLQLDGKPVDRIPMNLKGMHRITLFLAN